MQCGSWHLNALRLGDTRMNFGLTEMQIKFKLHLLLNVRLWEKLLNKYLGALVFSSVNGYVKPTFQHCCGI